MSDKDRRIRKIRGAVIQDIKQTFTKEKPVGKIQRFAKTRKSKPVPESEKEFNRRVRAKIQKAREAAGGRGITGSSFLELSRKVRAQTRKELETEFKRKAK